MLGKKDLARFQAELPSGVAPKYTFRTEPPYLQQFLYVLLVGVIFQLLLRTRPRSYLVGLTDDAVLLMPQPQPREGPRLIIVTRADVQRVIVKGGFGGKKIEIATRGVSYRMRIPSLQVRGDVKEALAALARFGAPAPERSPDAPMAAVEAPQASASPAVEFAGPAFHTPAFFAAPSASQPAAAVEPAATQLAPFCDRCGRAFQAEERVCPNDGRARRTLEA